MISVYYNQKYGFLIVPNAIEGLWDVIFLSNLQLKLWLKKQ